jgi:hypothetical protein
VLNLILNENKRRGGGGGNYKSFLKIGISFLKEKDITDIIKCGIRKYDNFRTF